LNRVCDDQDDDKVKNRHLAKLALARQAQHHHECQVDGSGTQGDLDADLARSS
jgi:hypothetical protein